MSSESALQKCLWRNLAHVSGLVQANGIVPNLKFLGVLACRNDRCAQTDEK